MFQCSLQILWVSILLDPSKPLMTTLPFADNEFSFADDLCKNLTQEETESCLSGHALSCVNPLLDDKIEF